MTPFPFAMSNKTYNFVKWFITIFLPAVATLYYGLTVAFDFNRVPGVIPAITALITFLGVIMGISTNQYNKTVNAPDGDLIVMEDPEDGTKHLGLGVNRSLNELTTKQEVRLKVVDKTGVDPQAPVE